MARKTRRVEVNDNEKKPRIVKNEDQEGKKPDVKPVETKEAPATEKKVEASEKKPEPTTPQKGSERVHLEPRKNVCMEVCKIKLERKGKEVECGRLYDLVNHIQFADAKNTRNPDHQ